MRASSSWIERIAQRVNMLAPATLYSEDSSNPVRIRNLSIWGAMVEANFEPRLGSEVSISRGKLSIVGKVAWTGAGQFGISFANPVRVHDWLKPDRNTEQPLADRVFLRVVGATEVETEASFHPEYACVGDKQAVDDFEEIVLLLSELGNELSEDLTVVGQHGHVLQNLDLALQILRRLHANTRKSERQPDVLASPPAANAA